MRARALVIGLFALSSIPTFAGRSTAAPSLPTNFAVDDAVPGAGFVTPTAIAFLPDGRLFVAEKRGRVYEVRNGVRRPTPIWSAEDEVLDAGDRGLLGITVDLKYYVNHYIYLLYVVDPDSTGIDDDPFAFCRLTRYQVNFTDSSTVVAASRTVLLGSDWAHGAVSGSDSHTVGSLKWGRDGSLLVTIGDGAHYELTDAGGHDAGAFGAGRTSPNEDIGAFRSQDITSLNGKLLRINSATGRGYASNPFYNGDARSVQSRIWCYGLRNPFRFSVRPGTGSADTSAANPGTLYVGDVGYNTYEELDVAKPGGANFGWPCYEGINPQSDYQAASPAHHGCGSIGTPTNPSPVRSPLATWHHTDSTASRPAGFIGNCAIGGAFYTGTQYPAAFRGQYLFADYGGEWIKLATLDVDDNLIGIADFVTSADAPVDLETDPLSGDLFYVSITTNQVRRIRYTAASNGNIPPIASVSGIPSSGMAPLTVAFSSAGTADPDGDVLTLNWAFTDGTGSLLANPTHVFTAPGIYNVQLTVNDGRGGTDIKYLTVTVTPPFVPFPSTPVLDDFNRANGAVGASWVDETGAFAVNADALAPLGDASMEWNGSVFGPDQEAFITLSALSTSAPEHNLMLKTQGTTWRAGHVEVSYVASTSTVAVATYDPDVGWQSRGQIADVTLGAGDRFGARVLGTGVIQVFRNGTLLGTVSAASWPYVAQGGRIGVSCVGATTSRFDDFGGGNVVAANSPPVALISQPLDGSFYYTGQTVLLSGSAVDQQSPPESLTYHWVVDLYHNNHVHPGTFNAVGPAASFIGMNHDDGTGVHLLVKLTATDPQGLTSDTAKVTIWPEIDLTASPVTVSPNPPVTGQSAHYTFSLLDSGRMPAPSSHWVLRADNTVVGQGNAIVPAGGRVNLSADATLPATTTYVLRLTADSLAAVVETNESNNASVRPLAVVPTGTLPVDPASIPGELSLSSAFPNPSSGGIAFTLALPVADRVRWSVLDVQGREVWNTPDRRLDAGRWPLSWDGLTVRGPARAGVYLARVRAGERLLVRRFAIVR